MKTIRATLLIIIGLTLVACGDDTESKAADNNANSSNSANSDVSLEVVGTWDSNFSTVDEITETTWNDQTITAYDNTDNWAVTQNPDDAMFGPSLYNKIYWTEAAGESFHYCTVAFSLESEQIALDTANTSDSADLDGAGCGGFAWTMLTRQGQ